MLKACCQLELAPDVEWDVEMTPVDFVASFIVQMAKKSSSSIGKTFHIINDKPIKSRYFIYNYTKSQLMDWSMFCRLVRSIIGLPVYTMQAFLKENDCGHKDLPEVVVTFISSVINFEHRNIPPIKQNIIILF